MEFVKTSQLGTITEEFDELDLITFVDLKHVALINEYPSVHYVHPKERTYLLQP